MNVAMVQFAMPRIICFQVIRDKRVFNLMKFLVSTNVACSIGLPKS